MADRPFLVIIEDETQQQESLRDALSNAQFSQDIILLPRGEEKAYPSMESFAHAPEGRNPDLRGIIVADLFLADVVAPKSTMFPVKMGPVPSFHHLMYTIFKSPTDFSLVCGRLGVLQKMVNYYHRAHVEVYTYYPTYFATPNKPRIAPDKYLYRNIDLSDIKKFAWNRPNAFSEFLNDNNLDPDDKSTGIEMLQCLALRDALDERLKGIFRCNDTMMHITDGPERTHVRSHLATDTSVKSEELEHSKLVEKIATILKSQQWVE